MAAQDGTYFRISSVVTLEPGPLLCEHSFSSVKQN